MGLVTAHLLSQAIFIFLLTDDIRYAILSILSYAMALVVIAIINMIALDREQNGKSKN